MKSVNLNQLSKSFGAVSVIRDISLQIEEGEFCVLVGPSGCGKSTLLRIVAGLESATDGEVLIDGKDVTDLSPRDRDIAMVFQNYALYPHMTVAENMSFSLRLKKVPQAEIDKAVSAAAGILSLDGLLKRYPRELSGGQRQRVAMGRAIVRNPKVFLFDEPLSNLDAKLRVQMRAEIKELHHKLRTTTIYVTHDQIEAMTMADKIVVMRDGRIEQIGTPMDLYDTPCNLFIATFIGSPAMNLIRGRVSRRGNSVFETQDKQHIALSRDMPHLDGREIILGIRPEHLTLANDPASGGLVGEVAVIEPTGAETILLIRSAGALLTVVSKDRVAIKAGDRVFVHVEPEKALLFDTEEENGRLLM